MQENVENFTKIIDRLSYIIEKEGDNFNKLALNIGLSNSYFSKMIKSKGSLGEDVIRKILLYYEKISPEWLLLGQGPILKEDQALTQITDKHISEMIQLICKLSEENGCMKAEKRQMKENIRQLKEENERLKQK